MTEIFMTQGRVWLFATLFLLAAASPSLADEMRTWTSRDGTASMEARFLRQSGDDVTLILPNGRSQSVKRGFLSEADVAWVDAALEAKAAGGKVDGRVSSTEPNAKIPRALNGRLVDADGKSVTLGADGSAVPKYYLFYYSASWCGPCVAFTPDLVRFYNRMKTSNPELVVVLVPSDRSAEDSLAYMKKARMSFPGVDYDKMNRSGIPDNPGNSIPAMRLTDENGVDLLTTTDTPRSKFLDEAQKLITAKSGS
jgi:nucleoredoxin